MGRRWPGCVLLVLVLIAVAAGHALLPSHRGGSAVAMLIDGPPQVGACVLWAPDPGVISTDFVIGVADADAADLGRLSDNFAFGPCSGVVAGEVASVSDGRPKVVDGSIGALMGTSGAC